MFLHLQRPCSMLLIHRQMGNLYIWNARYEEKKWIELASRFFDKTGKRINPDVLKEKLKNV